MTKLTDVLTAIEHIVNDDFCEDMNLATVSSPDKLTENEKVMVKKLSSVYRLAHSFNKGHSCYHIHTTWRTQGKEIIESALKEEHV